MPFPVLLAWGVGAAIGVTAARAAVKEWRRINAVLHPRDVHDDGDGLPPAKLRRDPQTGIYRPV